MGDDAPRGADGADDPGRLLIAHCCDRIGRVGRGQQIRRELLGLRRVVACTHPDDHVTGFESGGLGMALLRTLPLYRHLRPTAQAWTDASDLTLTT